MCDDETVCTYQWFADFILASSGIRPKANKKITKENFRKLKDGQTRVRPIITHTKRDILLHSIRLLING